METRTDGESPVAVKLALDYTLLEPPAELLQLKRLIEKATPQVTAGPEPLQIEGEAIEESEQDHQVPAAALRFYTERIARHVDPLGQA